MLDRRNLQAMERMFEGKVFEKRQSCRADGSEDEMDPEKVAQIEMWEREFKGLKSLRDEKRVEEK